MLIGLGDDTPVYGPPDPTPAEIAAVAARKGLTVDTGGGSSVTMESMTIRPQTVARIYSPEPGAKPSIVARVLPVKLGVDGKPRIYGLPPAVAYAVAVVIVGGLGYLAYQRFSGGGGRGLVASNSRRRRRARRASRRKR